MQTNKRAEPARRLPSAQRRVVGEKTKVLDNFFKNCGFPKGNALGALRRVRNLIVQAHLGVNLSIQVLD